jgi:predicted phosphodiesterase
MRYAIFSDIHNHYEALSQVLAHAGQQGANRYFCLGDIGDIRADRCITRIRELNIATVFGNWELLIWPYYSPENQQWLLNLPPLHKESHFWLTHAAPFFRPDIVTLADIKEEQRNLLNSKTFPYLHINSAALWKTITILMEFNIPLLFHGHTHCQIIWRFTDNNQLQKLTTRAITLLPKDILIVGVGSVGRSEDSPKPSYVIYDDQTQVIELIRV